MKVTAYLAATLLAAAAITACGEKKYEQPQGGEVGPTVVTPAPVVVTPPADTTVVVPPAPAASEPEKKN